MDFDLLTTIGDCDALIAVFTDKIADVNYRKEGAKRSAESLLERKTRREADLASVNAEITSLQSVIDSLPEGDIKDEFVYDKTLKEHELFRLQNSTVVSLENYFIREADKENYDSLAIQYGDHIAGLEARKTAIQNG